MAYATYITEALVCGTKHKNTSDSSYFLFTPQIGMILADAKSVREERSRQRYALQDFSLVRVSLIKGKQGWRIGSIEAIKNYYHEAIDKDARVSVVAIFRLLRRFVQGEEIEPDLFNFTISGLEHVIQSVTRRLFEQRVIEVKILTLLGYVDVKQLPFALNQIDLKQVNSYYTEIVWKKIEQIYTHAITVSQL